VCLVFAIIRSSFKNERSCLYSTFILHLEPNHTHHYGRIQSVSNIPTVVHHVADFLRNVHRVLRYKSDKLSTLNWHSAGFESRCCWQLTPDGDPESAQLFRQAWRIAVRLVMQWAIENRIIYSYAQTIIYYML